MNTYDFDITERPESVSEHLPWEVPLFSVTEIKPKSTKYCWIVIVWNEGDRIKNQLRRMLPFSELADVIIVDGNSDDGSTDADFLASMNVRSLLNTKEKGLCTATRVGLAYAIQQGYAGVVTTDGNAKDDVTALPKFLEKLGEGYDLIQGSRFMKGGFHDNTPLERLIGVKYIVSPLMSLFTGRRYTDVTNAFRACSAKYITHEKLQPFRHAFVRFNLQLYLNYRAPKIGMRVTEIPVARSYPAGGAVPTKITSLSTKLLFLKEFLLTIIGAYNP